MTLAPLGTAQTVGIFLLASRFCSVKPEVGTIVVSLTGAINSAIPSINILTNAPTRERPWWHSIAISDRAEVSSAADVIATLPQQELASVSEAKWERLAALPLYFGGLDVAPPVVVRLPLRSPVAVPLQCALRDSDDWTTDNCRIVMNQTRWCPQTFTAASNRFMFVGGKDLENLLAGRGPDLPAPQVAQDIEAVRLAALEPGPGSVRRPRGRAPERVVATKTVTQKQAKEKVADARRLAQAEEEARTVIDAAAANPPPLTVMATKPVRDENAHRGAARGCS
jgi:hypothetical protein